MPATPAFITLFFAILVGVPLAGLLVVGLTHIVQWYQGKRRLGAIGVLVMGVSALAGMMLLAFAGYANLQPRRAPQVTQKVHANPARTIEVHSEDGHRSTVQVGTGYASSGAHSGPDSYTLVSTRETVSFRFLIFSFPLALIVLFALWRHFGSERHEDDRPSAWKAVGTAVGLLFFVSFGMLFFGISSSRQVHVANEQQAQAVEETRLAAARAEQAREAVSATTIDELHEKLTEPRIKLDDASDEAEAQEATKPEAAGGVENNPQPGTAKPQVAVPDWVTNPPKRTGNVTRRVVAAGPYKTTSDCYRSIERKLEEAVVTHLQELVRTQPAFNQGHVSHLRRYNITPETILRVLCPPDGEYIEVRDTSVGEMKTLHVMMEFGPEQNAFLLNQWRQYERQDRIFGVTMFAGLVLAVVASVWGLLWLDTFTRGYYTKRLFLGVPAAIIGGICLIALIAEMS